jgi:hypothetical protein
MLLLLVLQLQQTIAVLTPPPPGGGGRRQNCISTYSEIQIESPVTSSLGNLQLDARLDYGTCPDKPMQNLDAVAGDGRWKFFFYT